MIKITQDFIKEVHAKSDVLISKDQLNSMFKRLAHQLNEDIVDKNPICVCVMNGALMMTAEITKRLSIPLQIDYVHATRYGNEYKGSSKLNWKKTPNISPEGRTVIIFDDILDGGVTFAGIIAYYKEQGAKEIITVAMLDKLVQREKGGLAKTDYVGLEVENKYVYGFGLDYHGYLRNIPAIHAVALEHMI